VVSATSGAAVTPVTLGLRRLISESIARSFVGVDDGVDIGGRWSVTRHHGSPRCSRGLSGDKRRLVVEGGAPPGLGVVAASGVGPVAECHPRLRRR
jgi:hypothetical protein